jgi:hypothetical protein
MRYTTGYIANKLATDDRWLYRGILAIHARQTSDEQAIRDTRHKNDKGWNAWDAKIMSSFACQIRSWDRRTSPYETPLSRKQAQIARKKMIKYAGQLCELANRKLALSPEKPELATLELAHACM